MLKDTFICHASEDKHLARSIWIRLEQYGITSWLDEAEMNAGDILVQKLSSAIHTSRWFIALLTPASVTKKWVTFELNQAMDREVRECRIFIIPIVADPCEIPAYLRNKVYIDLSDRDKYDIGIGSLLRTIKGDAHVIPPDFMMSDLRAASEDELLSLPRAQFVLEHSLRSPKYIARTVRTLAATANLLPKQIITYCESAPHISVCPTIDASGDLYYGLEPRIMGRYRSSQKYQSELTMYLRSLKVHSSQTYPADTLAHFMSFHA
jgi:TIR domain